ncbi:MULTISPECIES: DUF1002 domain-containing protein [Clostridium]|uniref:DUF1002 domain-containing protein n=1 Tax=Clostridium butyricum TaxID=1492 RepID=A0A6N3G9M5_CLOBU|nr:MULTISPECIES: DUF1002 domain-containing protein [Clostridium]EMU53776.1 hypothetical protein CBDKU1_22920 [Clostridium butyricum DKU-01]ENZ33640.1 hypothetical protein HMPREF1084_02110 [Clostridium butyricum 60E.3]MBO1685014.1 DUF1002 domain-containing protein [Clostridium butyricum]MDB2137128.1 DUF1002 domain-containing protein [Clostridium butyricum]MDI9207837.1 DUF1002 domain-containing protein [Clostridium butyricum]
MVLKKKFISSIVCLSLIFGNITCAFADSSKVVTIGADLSDTQKQTVLDYFGVKKDEAVILEVNNLEERKYLQGIASEAQLGTKTFSCAYVEPAKKGNGINVKTANLTYVTSSMIASTLATCGVEDANVIAMTPLSGGVSGTGALTGVMKAFEDATGKELSEDKKELASKELITTSDLGDEIGQDEAAGLINDIKADVIKNGTKDTNQIAETINNVTNNYNITLTPSQEKQISDLMTKISEQDYDYNSLKNTFKNVSDAVDKNLQEAGININRSEGFFSSIGNWFKDLFSGSKDLGILENTNDTVLGDDVKVDATDKDAIKNIISDNGFWEKIKNWFSGLFNSSSDKTEEDSSNNSNSDSKNSNTDINSENTSQTENNTNASENNTSEHSEKEKASENISTNNQN